MGNAFWLLAPIFLVGFRECYTRICFFLSEDSLWQLSQDLLYANKKVFSTIRCSNKEYSLP